MMEDILKVTLITNEIIYIDGDIYKFTDKLNDTYSFILCNKIKDNRFLSITLNKNLILKLEVESSSKYLK